MYRIGFDAKRAFKNTGGLGNYSRSAIISLSHFFNYNEYILYTPAYKQQPIHSFANKPNITVVTPNGTGKVMPSLWRSCTIKRDLGRDNLHLFHGLSGELPVFNFDAAKIVTIHDLIFIRYPGLYKPIDRWFYRNKAKHAARVANKIIAISKQTADDIVEFFGTDPSKIEVVYQSCHHQFYNRASQEQIDNVQRLYNFPKRFIVAMGAVEERKNVVNIVKALPRLPSDVKLYCLGKWTPYVMRVNAVAEKLGVKDRVVMLHNVDFSHIPAIYSLAQLLVYVSHFEGFGIPVLEGITYGIPVVTSGGTTMHEAGGDSPLYVNPFSPSDIGDKIEMVLSSPTLKVSMIERGYDHAKGFKNDKVAERLFGIYKNTIDEYGKRDNKSS